MSALADEELVTVRLDLLPLDVQTAAQQHGDELTRELVLVAERLHQQTDGAPELPLRFVELVTALNARYSVFTAEQEQQLAAALAAGDSDRRPRSTACRPRSGRPRRASGTSSTRSTSTAGRAGCCSRSRRRRRW